jgi:hypothetical protein
MAYSRNPLLALGLMTLVGACTTNPSPPPIPSDTTLPSPTATSLPSTPMPSATAAIAIACGPLSPEFCTLAVAVIEEAVLESHAVVTAVSIELPSTLIVCPSIPSPSVAPPSPCKVIASVTTAEGEVKVFLAWSGDRWTVESIR